MSLQSLFSKKWLIVAVKLLIVVLVAWFVRDTLVKAWRQIGEQTWHWQPFWLLSAGAIYLIGLLPAAAYWHYVLKVLGQDARWVNTLRAYYIGHLGKYVPGKAMVVILRTGMVRGQGVDTGVAAVSVFFETLTMMAVGAFMAAGILAVRLREERDFWGAIGMMIISGLPVVPPIFRRLARLAGIGKSDPAVPTFIAPGVWHPSGGLDEYDSRVGNNGRQSLGHVSGDGSNGYWAYPICSGTYRRGFLVDGGRIPVVYSRRIGSPRLGFGRIARKNVCLRRNQRCHGHGRRRSAKTDMAGVGVDYFWYSIFVESERLTVYGKQ